MERIDNNPLVSVLIPAYNHQVYVQQAIESVLNQTYKNIELIVIDDGSKDRTREIIENFRLERNDDFLFITRSNKGLIKTLEEGFSYMHGEYFCLLASDDYWDDRKIEEQVNFMKQDKNMTISFTDYYVIKEKTKECLLKSPWKNKKYRLFDVLNGVDFSPASIMTRKELIKNIDFPDNIYCVEDLYLWLYILRQGGYAKYLRKPLAYYRVHGNNSNDRMLFKILEDHYTTIRLFSNGLKNQNRILSHWAVRNANILSRKHKKLSRYYLLKSLDRFYTVTFIKAVVKLLFF